MGNYKWSGIAALALAMTFPRIACAYSSGSNIPTGTAGAPAAAVVSIQGVASGTVVPTTATISSGTVTANQGTAGTVANGWPIKPTDGTNSQAYTATGAAKVDGSAVTQPVSGTVTTNQATTDPCQSSAVAKSSAVIAATATAQLVALVAGKAIYVCGYSFSIAGTTPTVQFEYGTGVTCGTGTTALTGTYALAAGSDIISASAGTVFTAPASNALCIVLGGTTPSAQGVLSYVSQ